ncbi:MAG: GreA/GreB family elongation factor [Solirubrobacterales bacterium]
MPTETIPGSDPRSASHVESPAPRPRAVITRERERALRTTLDRLHRRLDGEFPTRLRQARTFGEVAGNDDYLQTIEEEAVLTSRISGLERLLASATVVLSPVGAGGAAAIGTTVEVEDLDSGEVRRLRLIGDYEQPIPDTVSASSPVGVALLGRSRGDEVEVELPNGSNRMLRIVAVRASARS